MLKDRKCLDFSQIFMKFLCFLAKPSLCSKFPDCNKKCLYIFVNNSNNNDIVAFPKNSLLRV